MPRTAYHRSRECSWMDCGPRRTTWEGQRALERALVLLLRLGGVDQAGSLATAMKPMPCLGSREGAPRRRAVQVGIDQWRWSLHDCGVVLGGRCRIRLSDGRRS